MHELGVRVALGATAQRIAAMVISEGLKLTVGGALVGIVAAILLTRVLSALLFGVGALDPLTFTVVLLLLLAVATLASYVPARRAARADPLVAMRGD
jgi:ABC-type antimicrobial peptide transport system permease subunit